MMEEELSRLREEIDRIDDDLLARLARRAAVAHRVGEIKHGAMYRPEREAQVLRRMMEANPGPLPGEAVGRIFREVMSACMALEQPLAIAYLGPRGTFSESAARKHFGASPGLLDLPSIDDVFRAVESGNANYAVVPVENSTEGAIGRTLDLLLDTPLQICGEVNLRVHQLLLSKRNAVAGVERIYSHAQSLAQCHEWLNRNLSGVERVAVASNAEAARLAERDEDACAIAGEAAATLYGLNVHARNIEDDPNNTTRFLVLGGQQPGPSGQDKTSLVCAAANRPGGLHELLGPLAHEGVSMTKLESRPSGSGLWEYLFFIDIEGHPSAPNVAAALTDLRRRAAFVKVLGAYPRAAF